VEKPSSLGDWSDRVRKNIPKKVHQKIQVIGWVRVVVMEWGCLKITGVKLRSFVDMENIVSQLIK
jgi:hypothetical protein